MWMIFGSALALQPATCPPADELLDTERWFRAASLDIRGHIPTVDEYQDISQPGVLPEDRLDEWLSGEAFTKRVVRHHKGLLWPGFADTRFVNNFNRITTRSGIWRSTTRDRFYRGGPNQDCGSDPAQFDDDGRLVIPENGEEGWVRVHPYWEPDPSVTIKVCALDAQDVPVSPAGIECNGAGGRNDIECGCGPDLAYCLPPEGVVALRESMTNSVEARITDLLQNDRPYTDLLKADTIYVNGPLVHFYRNQSKVPAAVRVDLPPLDFNLLPDLAFYEQDTWLPVPVHSGHSGVLTDPVFLSRFMTNRARVNQFYNSFLCQPFTAPAGGITGLDVQNPTLDLANRDGCNYCHAIVEPDGAYWGRWTENGAGYLDPDVYPAFDPNCAQCSEESATCTPECRLYYTVNPLSNELDSYVGKLRAFQFLPDSQIGRIDEGPSGLVDTNIANGKLQSCVAEKAGNWLLGRELTDNDDDLLRNWTGQFVSSDWNYRTLVKNIVLSDAYRRAR